GVRWTQVCVQRAASVRHEQYFGNRVEILRWPPCRRRSGAVPSCPAADRVWHPGGGLWYGLLGILPLGRPLLGRTCHHPVQRLLRADAVAAALGLGPARAGGGLLDHSGDRL